MATVNFTTNLALALPTTGDLTGTWGTAVNTGISELVDQALGYQAFTATGGSDTLTIPDAATGVARSIYIQLNGTGGGTVNVPTTKTKMYFVFNNTASAITFKVTGQTGVSIPAAAKMALVSNGTDIIVAQNYFTSLTLGSALPVASGGTGITSFGTGVATALGVNTGSSGAFVVNGGALGSPSSAGTIPAFTLGGTIAGGGNQINNVIIGTSTPLAGAFTTVTATGNITSGGILQALGTVQSSSGADLSLNANGANRDVIVKVNGTEQARFVGSTGNVGIGTSSPIFLTDILSGTANTGANVNNPSQLSVTGANKTLTGGGATVFVNSNSNTAIDTGGSIALTGRNTTSSTNSVVWGVIKGAKENGTSTNGAGYLAFATGSHSAGAPVEAMRIDSSGNVGVGTSTPSTYGKLVVVDGTLASINTGGNAQLLTVANSSVTLNVGVNNASIPTNASITTVGSHTLGFGTVNTERARISTTGGFSVGTTSDPGAGAIYATGNITAFFSDKRLKTVSGKIENALDKVAKLSGVYYTFNDTAKSFGYDSDEEQVGVLAQDVEAVLPQIVKAAPFDLDENGNSKSGENYKTVQYEKLVPLLIEAINELRAEVKALKGA